jgi:hypothetical protein
MPLWGKKDQAAVTGTVVLTNGSTTVTGNTAVALNTELKVGDAIFLSTANTAAGANTRYRVTGITNATSITVDRTYAGTTNAAATVYYQKLPRPITENNVGMRVIDVVGVDLTEAQVASNKAKGIVTPGWTRVVAGTGGRNGRYTVETLVAMRSMTAAVASDANDDTTLADS